MNTGEPAVSRNTWLAVGLVGFVVACGFGGMLVGRHILHPNAAIAASTEAPPRSRLPSTEPLRNPGPLRTPQVQAHALPGVPVQFQAPPSAASQPPTRNSSKPNAPAPNAAASNATTPTLPANLGRSPGAVTEEKEIGLALHRWQEALLSNDARQIAPSYAAEVDRYFLRTHVKRSYIEHYMSQQEDRGAWLLAYELRDIAIESMSENVAEVQFIANFTVSTEHGDRSGTARTELKMRREQGDWKIYSERDFRS